MAVAATTAGTAMAVPVFVGTKKKKKIILRAAAYESFSPVKPDSHMHAHTRARTTIKVQSSNSEHVLAAESCEWLSTARVFPRLVKYPTNFSVISFQDASLASPKLSVALFKDHQHSGLFFHVCFSV